MPYRENRQADRQGSLRSTMPYGKIGRANRQVSLRSTMPYGFSNPSVIHSSESLAKVIVS